LDVILVNWELMLLPYSQAVSELIAKAKSFSEGFAGMSEPSPIETVEGRVKSTESILEKAKRKNIPIDEIETKMEDIAGIRIICRFVDDIKKVVEFIRERDGFDLKIIKEHDYIENVKPSGYRSYHIIIEYPVITAYGKKNVLCEIQIRTLAMNFWAIVEHSLKYKYQGQIPEDIHNRLLRSAEAAFRLDNEISEIRGDIIEAEHKIRAEHNRRAANPQIPPPPPRSFP